MLIELRRRAAVVTATLAVIAVLCGSTAAAAATDPSAGPTADSGSGTSGGTGGTNGPDLISFGIAPAGADHADDRPYISIEAGPGSVVYDHVALVNQDSSPIALHVYSVDVGQADQGGLAARTADDASVDVGKWVSVDGPTTVDVPAQTAGAGYGFTIVPIAITIPTNAEPGDHLGGIVASFTAVGQGGGDSPNLNLEQRVVGRIYIRVAGELKPALEITGVSATWTRSSYLGDGSTTVTYTLKNTGNMRLAVEPAVTVAGPFGLHSRTAEGDRVDELLPGGATTLTTTVPDGWAMVRNSVTIDAVVVANSTGEDPGLGTISATTVVWSIPWLALGVLVLLIAWIAWVIARRRRRRNALRSAAPGSRKARRAGAVDVPAGVSEDRTDQIPAGAEGP